MFEQKEINDEQKKAIDYLNDYADGLLDAISSVCKDGRLKSIAITKLEECVLFVNKSISHDGVES